MAQERKFPLNRRARVCAIVAKLYFQTALNIDIFDKFLYNISVPEFG